MAVVKGVTSRQAGGGGGRVAPTGTEIMDLAFSSLSKAAVRMFPGTGSLMKCI